MRILLFVLLIFLPVDVFAAPIENIEKDIAEYSNRIAKNKDDADAYFKRGSCYVRLDTIEQTQEMAQNMDIAARIMLNPEANNIQKLAATSTARQVVEYKKARDKLINNTKAPLERAIDDYSIVIKLRPQFADVYYKRHMIYKSLQNDELARADYNSWAKLDPEGAKKLEKEREDARKAEIAGIIMGAMNALKKDPKNAELYNVLGKAYIEKEDYTKAVVNFTKAIKFQPKNGEFYYNRGNAHTKCGNKTFAAVDLAKAKKLGYK
jgi:tetratricopeptide (TPR) repeat protein